MWRALSSTGLLVAPLLAAPAIVAQGSGGAMSPAEVRELGRLERVDMVPVILPSLDSESADSRAEAANALAQSLWPIVKGAANGARIENADSVALMVARTLASRLRGEREPAVAAAIAQSLGRLPYANARARRTSETVLARTLAEGHDARVAAGAARGLLSLLSSADRDYEASASTLDVLRSRVSRAPGAVAAASEHSSDSTIAWSRRLAMLALIAARSADTATVRMAAKSSDAQLRMLAARAAAVLDGRAAADTLLRVLARDSAPMVRTEVARAWSRPGRTACLPLLPLAHDSSPQTSVSAIDAIGIACVGKPAGTAGSSSGEAEGTLAALVREGATEAAEGQPRASADRLAMHRAAHAIVALAHLAPARATALLPAVAASDAWQARMYAARAAAILGDTARLLSLAADPAPNVRTEAVAGLSRVAGHASDSVYIEALSAGDYQLVLMAAQALRDTPRPDAAIPALERSLARISAEKRETSRDPRIALLVTLRDLGSAQLAEALLPYLVDFDPAVADTAAAMVSAWTGRPYRSAPRPLPPVDEPPRDVAALRAARVRVTMAPGSGGGSFELRLFPDDAPITVSRFVRLVRSGYYNGLTWHRVVPNFVVQGGSPGANEYVGDGPFLRDEVGLRSHRRGSVGISTRGRNTGDAQIFIDLVDLPRLDHDYTVFAEVVSGMATVDRLLEGDVMAKVELIAPR
ncbi:MAG TPA: peptidylprolyl isomerase [Gemmatimonadaceae bacterium]|nr:peptidylprolyl isomerase [Gemmatimonadaceae bacterium]